MSEELRYLDSLQGSGVRPGLIRMRRLLRAAAHPQRRPAVIVAGTNGKGSTAATLASILSASGYRTGFYSSPHLVDLRERWMIDGQPVSRARLIGAIRRLRQLSRSAGIKPTYFEALTVIAFLIFEAEEVDLTVLEVGMGGRLDATNVVRPLASVITPVGRDHVEFLGRTVRGIAREKAGVIHRGSIALTSNTDPVVLEVIRRRAGRFGVPVHVLANEVEIRTVRLQPQGMQFNLKTPQARYQIDSPLTGVHQVDNVALAVRTAEELRASFPRINKSFILRGVAETRWRGRLEKFEIEGREVWVDGAHNAHALTRIVPFISSMISTPRTLVFGVLKDKDAGAMLSGLLPLFDRVIFTTPDSERAIDPEALREAVRRTASNVEVVRALPAAIRAALRKGSGPVVVCGSLYLAGEALAVLDRLSERAAKQTAAAERTPLRPEPSRPATR